MVLLVLLLRRSKAALAEVYRRHGDAAFSAAMAAATATTTAEDLTCARFVDLWHDPDAYDPQSGSLRSFLIGGIGRDAGPLPAAGPPSAAATEPPAPRPHPPAAHALLEGIPAEEALAIDLAYFGHHTSSQIAQLLNEPEQRIRDRIRGGLTRLAERPSTGERDDRWVPA